MTAEFTALAPGWVNIYHNKEINKLFMESCPGVITYVEAHVDEKSLRLVNKTFAGYASFSSDGSWYLAALRPHYIKTFFAGVDSQLTRELYDEFIEPKSQGNLWIIE